ncbi:MAG: hypothetical protein RBQ99_08470 [Trichlorobacter sp.]|jgi:hypothetical protein|nr:hypothetical protein [Trichlorobacter sp.]
MGKKIETMSPDQIAARGRELIKLAKRKEAELRQQELLQIGQIFQREMLSAWPSTWDELQSELEQVIDRKVSKPHWIQKA